MKNKCILLIVLALAACREKPQEIIPDTPDYTHPANWYHIDRGGQADLFYICSTCVYEPREENGIPRHCVNVTDSLDRKALLAEMRGVDRRLSGGTLNYYSPYYRQMIMDCYEDKQKQEKYGAIASQDIQTAFRHYMATENKGRPFILAGFSQGGQMIVELLRSMPDSVYRRMVAAYVLGWYITEEDIEASGGHLVPARGADDIGVTICYNSVKDPSSASFVSEGNVVAINPVNWRTDTTSAQFNDSLTVHLDPETKLLLVDGYKQTNHAFLPWFDGGNYHTFEIRWYTENLRENMQERLSHFSR